MSGFEQSVLIVLCAFFLIATFGCDKTLEDINTNPNGSTDAPLEVVFNGAMVGIIQANEGENARYASVWSGQFSGSGRNGSIFFPQLVKAQNFSWRGFYYSILNLNVSISKAKQDKIGFYEGAAKIVKAHQFATMAALWGDIPFYQAANIDEYLHPSFDPQQSVYNEIQLLLDEGIKDLETKEGEGKDFFYKGNRTAWIKLAHTLKARYYLHIRNYAAALAHAKKGIDTKTGNWVIPHTKGMHKQDMNLFHSYGKIDRQGDLTAVQAYLPSILDTSTNQPGKRNHSKTNEGERFSINYITEPVTNEYAINFNGSKWSANSPYILVSVEENKLIEAECELRLNNQTEALGALNEVRSNLRSMYATGKYEPYVITDFELNGIEDNGKGSIAQNLLYEILEEKYTSLVGSIEVFCDLRRTRNFLEIPFTSINAKRPERFLIPQNEINSNKNTPSPIPGLYVPTPVNN